MAGGSQLGRTGSTAPSRTTIPNPDIAVDRLWVKFVLAACKEFASRYFAENPTEMNRYADHEDYGFLRPEYRDASAKGGFAMSDGWGDNTSSYFGTFFYLRYHGTEMPDDPKLAYLGMVNKAELSKVKAKSTGLYRGTGTVSAKAVLAAAKAFTWNQLARLSAMAEENPKKYTPLASAGQTKSFIGDKDLTLNRYDINLGIQLFKKYRGYRDFVVPVAGGATDFLLKRSNWNKLNKQEAFVLSHIRLREGGGEAIHRPLYKSNLIFGAASDFWKSVTVGTGFQGKVESLVTWSTIDEEELKDKKNKKMVEAFRKSATGDSDDEMEFIGAPYMRVMVGGAKGSIPVLGAVLSKFVDRVALNHPVILRGVIDKIIKDLIKDIVYTDRIISTKKTKAKSFTGAKKKRAPKAAPKPKQLTPIDLQCFLMDNIGLITEFKEQQSVAYNNVITLGNDVPPGETISILNLKEKQREVEKLLNLAPSTYAMLMPYIKLYRVDYDKKTGTIPLAQQEIPIPNYLDPGDVNKITGIAGHGRMRGWGLQSFNWKLDGTQPATVDNNISATLKFYFQTVDDLFQGAHEPGVGDVAGRDTAGPLDLLFQSRGFTNSDEDDSGNEPSPNDSGASQESIEDMNCSDQQIKEHRNEAWDGARYRIKVVAGWSTPPNLEGTHPSLKKKSGEGSETDGQLLRKALADTRISLYLQQTRHNLTFNENGSVSLTINYQAALSGMLTSNIVDILGATDEHTTAQLKVLEDKIKIAAESLAATTSSLAQAELDANRGSGGTARVNNNQSVKAKKKKLKEYLEKKKAIINQDKIQKYQRFLQRLYGRTPSGKQFSADDCGKEVLPPKIYTLEVSPHLLRQTPLSKVTDPEERKRRAKALLNSDYRRRGYAISNVLAYRDVGNTDLADLLGGLEGLEDAGSLGKETKKQFEMSVDRSRNIFIPYFYLGDLIDSILENNVYLKAKSSEPNNYMTFMAEMDITNPLLLYQADNVNALICADTIEDNELIQQLRAAGRAADGGIKKRINIGSIPVSIDQFNVWFKNNVVMNERNTYYLLHFVKDICAQLISSALKEACYGSNLINDIRFDVSHVQFNNTKGTPDDSFAPVRRGSNMEVRELARIMGSEASRTKDIPPVSLTDPEERGAYNLTMGLVVYCTDASPQNRPGGRESFEDDLDAGIYHNYIGSPVGLVKKIAFNRISQTYLREAKIQKFGNLGAQQLKELYSANLDLIGNTLYKNGQYMFIWPSAMATSNDQRVIDLGLGGYFQITSVSHTIGRSGYDVSVSALQQNVEMGHPTEVTATYTADDDAPDDPPNFREEPDLNITLTAAEQEANDVAAAAEKVLLESLDAAADHSENAAQVNAAAMGTDELADAKADIAAMVKSGQITQSDADGLLAGMS